MFLCLYVWDTEIDTSSYSYPVETIQVTRLHSLSPSWFILVQPIIFTSSDVMSFHCSHSPVPSCKLSSKHFQFSPIWSSSLGKASSNHTEIYIISLSLPSNSLLPLLQSQLKHWDSLSCCVLSLIHITLTGKVSLFLFYRSLYTFSLTRNVFLLSVCCV